jgi:hypothetical protein
MSFCWNKSLRLCEELVFIHKYIILKGYLHPSLTACLHLHPRYFGLASRPPYEIPRFVLP